jgi:bacterioferritin-associated ferredoxin
MNQLKEDVICYCSGTTKEQINALIVQGIIELDLISRQTGACSGCGACDVVIMELIAECGHKRV